MTPKILGRLSGLLARPWAALSRSRRSRLAAPVVLLLSLVLSGSLYAALSPASASDKIDDAATVAQGKELYQIGCSSCHGANAEGISTKRGNQYGPSLVGVGAAAVDFQVATGRMPMARPGTQALSKAPSYDEEETRALAAYIASLGPGPSIPTEADYTLPYEKGSKEYEEAVKRGGEFFRTNCTACHNFAGTGGALPEGRFAPSLKGVEKVHLYEAMLTGPQQMPVFSDQVLTPEDKASVIAYLKTTEEAPSYGGFTLGSFGPVAEGLAAWSFIGILVGFAVWIAAHSTRSKKRKAQS